MEATIQVETKTINISVREFSRFPGPRFKLQGKSSGEEFFNLHLEPKFKEAVAHNQKLVVNLDGTEGYSSAFLDGSFGVLARKYGADKVMKTLDFITNDEPYLRDEIIYYMKQKVK